ncbi:aspartyl protease family protein At5g10770-like [Macadamia integrifolia]|uniref:aspartyl protease family protein At5g10770-like n=1 Tax=Macadamia integrifolia TaxID=60698 RepID=UPI001C4EB975|nr:aspartyl protease family protein At5g10770-like [Macadamia integrifolia]
MAIINYSAYFLFLLLSTVLPLFLFSCSEKVEAYRFGEMFANHQLHTFHVVSLSSLQPAAVCSTSAQGSKNICKLLPVAHKYGPCSPLKKGKSKFSIARQILIDDENRVKSIHSKISNKQSPVADSTITLPANSGAYLGTGNFVVNIGIGTPEKKFTVAFDTGSDLTWIQCLPCNASQCYSQQDPYFNPSASSTYSNIPCNSSVCTQLQLILGDTLSCNTTTTCQYQIFYGDSSFSQGDFATDTLTLSSSDVFPDFQFGCGHNNQGLFGSTDGLLGLSRDQISLVSQTVQRYGKLFSYCLPPTSSSTGFLAFGCEAGSSSTLQYTPLLTNQNDPLSYYLNMTGISVGGQMLNISESVFTTSGTIIDSGTVITRLAPTAYSALRSAFRQGMSKYPMAPSPNSIFDTCYDFSGYSTVDLPTIGLNFEGDTDLNVDQSGTLFQASSTVYCLAFAGNSADTDLGILGNTQQLTFEVVYDVEGAKLGFGAGACS